MCKVYGYARVSTKKQDVMRQIDNIKEEYPDAIIVQETYTGTTTDRPRWNMLYRQLKSGDTVVFDEVSRMSRNAAEGFELYQNLYNKGISLVFLKEHMIDTSVFRGTMEKQISISAKTGKRSTDNFIESITEALNQYMMDLAKEQIEIAFKSAEDEVNHLHKRTSEGVRKAQERYIRETVLGIKHEKDMVGRKPGSTIGTKKSVAAKEIILKHSKDFNGTLNDADVIKLSGISRNSYYKYKAELRNS